MKISVQCYTLREEFEKDVEGTFAELRTIGFNYVELAGLYGHSASDIRNVLDHNGLQVSGAHVGLDRFQNDFDGLVAECRTLGTTDLILPWVGEDVRRQGWASFSSSLKPILDKVEQAGMRFSYHNHAFEFQQEDGRPGLDVFYDGADPRLKAQLDLYWVYRGGQDPAAYIRKYKGRVVSTHLKDGTGEESPHVPPGQGVLNWDDILAAHGEAGVEVGAIEYDVCVGSPFDSVATSLEFFRGRGYKD